MTERILLLVLVALAPTLALSSVGDAFDLTIDGDATAKAENLRSADIGAGAERPGLAAVPPPTGSHTENRVNAGHGTEHTAFAAPGERLRSGETQRAASIEMMGSSAAAGGIDSPASASDVATRAELDGARSIETAATTTSETDASQAVASDAESTGGNIFSRAFNTVWNAGWSKAIRTGMGTAERWTFGLVQGAWDRSFGLGRAVLRVPKAIIWDLLVEDIAVGAIAPIIKLGALIDDNWDINGVTWGHHLDHLSWVPFADAASSVQNFFQAIPAYAQHAWDGVGTAVQNVRIAVDPTMKLNDGRGPDAMQRGRALGELVPAFLSSFLPPGWTTKNFEIEDVSLGKQLGSHNSETNMKRQPR